MIKIVLVGDTSVGKSCLIRNYLDNTFSEDYEPTVLDVYKGTKAVKRKQVDIEIHDTSGDEHLGVNRQIQYKGADIFIIAVAANAPDSLSNVNKWTTEIRSVCPNAPIMIVLTKGDLVEYLDEHKRVTLDMVKQQVTKESCQGSSQTSSKEWEDFNVHRAFVQAIGTGYFSKYDEELT